MNSMLKEIQPQLNKYAQILNSILEVDVEIIDDQMLRISGTGIYQDHLDISIKEEGFIYASVFENKGDRIVLDILNHPICSKCLKKEGCSNKLIISVPVMYNGEAVGVIGIISTEESKKKYIKDRLRQYLEFVHHISDLISAKLRESQQQLMEKKMQEMWMGIVNVIEHGVAILGENGSLLYINDIGRDLLGLRPGEEEIHFGLNTIQEVSDSHDRLSIDVNGRPFTLIGKLIALHSLAGGYDKLVIIHRLELPEDDRIEGDQEPHSLIGASSQMLEIQERIKRIANSTSTVLISGESGTGKELIAQEIHRCGSRRDKPFVAVNCGAIPEALLESELFGYVKGAFTGANLAGKVGKFELANTGILFLDEIGDMPLHLQVKILRVLQEKKLYRVGSNKVIDLDLKIIAATNLNLESLCEQGKFRMDLYYRLNVIQIEIPPLRERSEDIRCLFRHFVEKYSKEFFVKFIQISEETEDCICRYDWPGNVRELENAVEYAMNFVSDGDRITPSLLPARILRRLNPCGTARAPEAAVPAQGFLALPEENGIIPLEQMNREYLAGLLKKFGNNTESKKMIAQKLGIGTATLYRMLKQE